MPGRWGNIPFLPCLLCLAAGILTSQFVVDYSFAGLVLAGVMLLAAGFLALQRDRLRVALFAALGSVSLCGTLLGISDRDSYSELDVRMHLRRHAFSLDEIVLFDGCIAEEVETLEGDHLVTVELHGFRTGNHWLRCTGRALLRVAAGPDEDPRMPTGVLKYGDRIRGSAVFHLPRNFQNPGAVDRVGLLARRGIFLVGRVKSVRLLEVLPGDCGTSWKRAAIRAREALRLRLQPLAEDGRKTQAAVLLSLLIGDQNSLNTSTRETFQNAGTYHVLVVSGLHVAWIAWALLQVFRRLRLSPAPSRILVAAGILFYSGLVGFQASVSRCLWVYILYLSGQALFRAAHPLNLLSAGSFLMLSVQPGWLFDQGFQLSFLSVIAILLLGVRFLDGSLRPLLSPLRSAGDNERLSFEPGPWSSLGRCWRARAELLAEACADRGHRSIEPALLATFRTSALGMLHLGGMALISLSVQLWLNPVMAFHFNRLSWISPVSNLLVVPLASLTLASGILAVLADCAALPSLVPLGIATWCASALVQSTDWFSRLPGTWQRCATPSAFSTGFLLLLMFVWSVFQWRHIWIPCLATLLCLVWLGNGFLLLEILLRSRDARSFLARQDDSGRPREDLQLIFLDVGQGDSVVLRYPDRTVWVLDAGGIRDATPEDTEPPSLDIGEVVVSRYLWSVGAPRLERALLSHPHQDHAGGLFALIKNFAVREINYGEPGFDALLEQLVAAARARGVLPRRVQAGDRFAMGPVKVEVLNPVVDGTRRSINDNSVVVRLTYGRFSALLTGDLEITGETEVSLRARELEARLLKVAHHGSKSATRDSFLDRVRPRWAVISAGRNNPFGHPAREVLIRLVRHGARPLLTSDQGAITFRTDGARYTLSTFVSGVLEQGEF